MPHSPIGRVVLVTGADLRPGVPGGTRSYVLGLARFLDGHGIPVDLVSNGATAETVGGCDLRPLRAVFTPSSLRFQRHLRRWARREAFAGVDIMHFHRPDDLAAFRRDARIPPAVCTLHGDPHRGVRRRRGFLAGFAYDRLEARAFARFAAVIAVDSATARAYAERYPAVAGRIHVIPNAIDDAWLEVPRRRGGEPSVRPPVFLYAGRLSPEKRVDRIIRAVAVAKGLSGASLLIAGSGPEEPRLRSLANGSSVRFLGNLRREDLARLYETVDGLVLASDYEGLPSVALEALSFGCPVVAIRGCGVDDLVREGGGVIADGVGGLPEALLLAHRLHTGGSRIRLPEAYTWAQIGPRILQVYREALEATG